MKTNETIITNLNKDKTFVKKLNTLRYYSNEQFINDAKRYISAIKQGRMLCNIGSVSNSGMSRTMSFKSCEKSGKRYYYRNYTCLFICLDYSETNDKNGYFRIGGCGMDMVFHTNYTIIHMLYRYGFITKNECNSLAQQIPSVL
jgi:hypothetical protein